MRIFILKTKVMEMCRRNGQRVKKWKWKSKETSLNMISELKKDTIK
jgi:hypothetical protein